MMHYETVYHNFEPLYAPNSRVLLLGSMPSPKSRAQGFFYGHPQNRFWRVLAQTLKEQTPETIDEKRELCLRHHVALWDVLASCDIIGASDAAIKNPVPNDILSILQKTNIRAVFTTGAAAHKLYTRLCLPKTEMPAHALPSTSPANAAWSYEKLVESYQVLRCFL